MATTLPGTPYVEASDLVAAYPAASENLADRVDLVGVLPFATSAARATAIPTPTDGQFTYLQDTNSPEFFNGTAYQTLGTEPGLVHINTTTFTAQTSFSVNNVFTSTYDNYIMVAAWTVPVASSKTSSLRWRTSGVDNTAAVYHTNINGTFVYSQTAHGLGQNFYDGADGGYGFFLTVNSPQKAQVTNGFGGIKGASGGANLPAPAATAHASLTIFDGFTLAISASTFTGQIRTYGYKNS